MSTEVGQKYMRADGLEKVTGQGRYTADLVLPGMLEARFLYPPHSHARITRLDTARARAIPGVFAVLTQADVPQVRLGTIVKDRTLFADGVVRFDGEIVAAVAALTAEIAEEALAAIEVEYEPLPGVHDPEAALEEGSPLVHPDWESYAAPPPFVLPREKNYCSYSNIVKGDVEQGFAEADIIVEERYVSDMSHGVAIEPHAVVAQWQGQRVTVWSSTQVPYAGRASVAEGLEIPEHLVRVIVPTLGGGFGSKCDYHFEAHVAALARAANRPVRLVFDRREEFVAVDMTRHPIITEVKTGLSKDGTIVARQTKHILDTGAYAAHGPLAPSVATMMGAGPYRIDNLLCECWAVYTNRTVAGSVRAPTGPQICWAIEQHTDVCAEKLGMDPVEFRMKNLADEGDAGPTGPPLTAVGTKECLERACELIGYGEELPEGEAIGVGVGWWFSLPMSSGAHVQLNANGSATIITGAQENGSGAVMGLSILLADELGISPADVTFLYQDTDAAPFDLGSGGSQTTFNNGRAVVAAAEKIRKRLLDLAAPDLEADPADLELAEGTVRVKGAPEKLGHHRRDGPEVDGRRGADRRERNGASATDAGGGGSWVLGPIRLPSVPGTDVLRACGSRSRRP